LRSPGWSSEGHLPPQLPATRGSRHRLSGQARAALATLRPQQWVKQVLVFVPLAAAHRLGEGRLLAAAAAAFVAFTFCATAVYVLNDLIDLHEDKLHPHKRGRPLASGRLSIRLAQVLVPLLLLAGLATGALLDVRVDGVLATYFLLMLGYTLKLRAVALLDALILAVGYALRVVAGAFAVQVPPSSWLLAFCIFIFFSLALIKRHAELSLMQGIEGGAAHARAYVLKDQGLLLALGVATGTLAVFVLALYLSSAHAQGYDRAGLSWLVCVLLLYWLSHMWLNANRGRMSDDPLVFALNNRVSQVLIVLMGAAALFAV
jgi:4-hydroxybenzoate polyprenyltransferase